jgi:hypothetical protein
MGCLEFKFIDFDPCHLNLIHAGFTFVLLPCCEQYEKSNSFGLHVDVWSFFDQRLEQALCPGFGHVMVIGGLYLRVTNWI